MRMSVVVVETPRHLRYVLSDQHILFRCTLIPFPLLPLSLPLSVVSECSVRRSAQASWVPQTLPPSLPRMPLCHPQVSPFFYFPPFLSSFFPAIRLTFSLSLFFSFFSPSLPCPSFSPMYVLLSLLPSCRYPFLVISDQLLIQTTVTQHYKSQVLSVSYSQRLATCQILLPPKK